MKVLLADTPVKGTKIDDSYPNLGLLYLAGSLKTGIERKDLAVTYLGPKHDLKSHLEVVKQIHPQVYGISFTSKAATLAYQTIRAVREVCPDTRIIAGGAHPTALPTDIFHESPVDVIGFAEGEITFTELIKAYLGSNKPDLESIQGIAFRHNGEVIQTKLRPFIENLDSIPFPAWDLVDFQQYPGMHLKKQPIESSLLISRGCPFFHCALSTNRSGSLKNRGCGLAQRKISVRKSSFFTIVECELYLSSDELNFNEKWAIDLCKTIARLKHSDLYFQCNMRADKVLAGLVDALKEMNCWMIHLGVESANDRVLQGIGKKVTIAQIEEAARLLSRRH